MTTPERLVIVGNGMAATRLVEMLVARRYQGHITVLGDEEMTAYNRSLLSAVLEGTHTRESLTMRSPERSEEHTSELRSLIRIPNAVFCMKNTKHKQISN